MTPPDKRYFRIWPHAAFPNPVRVTDHDPNTGEDLICATFSASFLPYLLGALEPLTSQDAWDTDDLATAETNVYRVRMLQELLMGGECDMGLQGIRFVDCDLQITEDGENWTTVTGFDPSCFEGPQGAPGIPGADGTDGTDGIDGTDGANGASYTAPPPAPQGNDAAVMCGVATRLEDQINATVNTVLSAAGAAVSLSEVITNILQSIPAIGWTIVPLGQAVQSFLSFGLSAAETFINDPNNRAAVRCIIYCRLIDAGGYSRPLLDAAMTEVAATVAPSDVFLAYALLVSAFDSNYLQAQAYLGSLDPSAVCDAECTCSDNPCKPGYWNFAGEGPLGWTTAVPTVLQGTYSQGFGTFIEGEGWQSVTDGDRDRLRIFFKCPEAMSGGSFVGSMHYSTPNWENRYGVYRTFRQDTGAFVGDRGWGQLQAFQSNALSYTALIPHDNVPVYLVIDFNDDLPATRSMTIHDLSNT